MVIIILDVTAIVVISKIDKDGIKSLKVNSSVHNDWKNLIGSITEDGVSIPKAFKFVTGTKATGTVIQDSIGNEFVWISATAKNYVKDFSFSSNYSAIS